MRGGAAIALGFAGLRTLTYGRAFQRGSVPYGGLVPDPEGILDLPAALRYTVFSRTGETMDDGFFVPGAHDGMAAFPGSNGRTILVRNHELQPDATDIGPFGDDNRLMARVDAGKAYDSVCLGGTTTLIYDTREQRLERHFLSLTGTIRNCAGGPTPWGSWVTCEEAVDRAGRGSISEDHGFAFEVPSGAAGLVAPVPLRAMGRFYHEAIAVDRASGVVYETEDRGDSLFYRFIPDQPGALAGGGRLQALRILGMDGANTSNRGSSRIPVGERLEVGWVNIDNVDSPGDDLRDQGASKGAARFSRGEGIWAGPDAIFFAATSGGVNQAGQIWRYRPSSAEGTSDEAADRGSIELFVEPNDTEVLENADNLTVAPWGDVIICEDGPGGNFLRGVTPVGDLYTLARNAMNGSEFAGVTFSPDGTTLFVNIQRPGLTLAVAARDTSVTGQTTAPFPEPRRPSAASSL